MPIFPSMWGSFIATDVMKIFVDRLHNVLFLDLAIKQYPKFSGLHVFINIL